MMQQSKQLQSKTTLSFKNNSLNIIRLLAALQVFYGHAINHLELESPYILGVISPLLIGVPIFFILSGYLIWASIDRTPNMKTYFKKRVFRIYPELWIGVAVSILSILILYDNVDIVDITLFTFTQSTFMQFWTPNSLRGFGCGTPNGSLWTICVIVQFYIVAWFLKKILERINGEGGRKIQMWITILVTLILMDIITPILEPVFPNVILYKLFTQTIVPYMWMFMLGAFICEYFDSIVPVLKKWWFVGLILLVLVTQTNFDIPGTYSGIIHSILLGITWLGFAYAYPRLNIKHDISYGIYIYHMIIINIVLESQVERNYFTLLAVLGVTLVMAMVSYVVVGQIGRKRRNK